MCTHPASTDWAPVPLHGIPAWEGEHEVHAWLLPLDAPPRDHALLVGILSPDERERAARFHFEHDRRRFEAARGLLRLLLGRYAGCPPSQIGFSLGAHGKPALDPMSHPSRGAAALRFNVSHSGGQALVGLTRGAAIGVDIEVQRAVPEHEAIAQSNFAPEERRALARLPAARQLEGFFTVWTRKEAYVKAVGAGLQVPLQDFVVSADPDAAPALHSIAGSREAASAWTLWAARPHPQTWAAIAVQHRHARIRTFSLGADPRM